MIGGKWAPFPVTRIFSEVAIAAARKISSSGSGNFVTGCGVTCSFGPKAVNKEAITGGEKWE